MAEFFPEKLGWCRNEVICQREVISVVSGVANCIPRYIRTYLHFSIQQWGNEGGGVIPRFQDFPPSYFLRTFLCHREYCQVFETSEIAFVAICGRSSYKMPGLLPSWRSLVRDDTYPASNLVTHKNRFNETIVCDYDVAIFPHGRGLSC